MSSDKKSQISHGIKHRKNPKDKFYTPIALAIELIKLVPLTQNDIVLDPCLGKGAFYNNFPSYVEKKYCEIDLGIDFFTYNEKVDWCISNPPYSLIDKWFAKSCKICRKGFGYLIGLDNYTAKRMEDCNTSKFYLTKLHMFKVYKWFGMSCFVLFEKNKENIITYNRIVWREGIEKENYKTIDQFIKK